MSRSKFPGKTSEIVRVIHTERVNQGLTLKAMARLTGWTDITIGNMERGCPVKFQIVLDCAQALGVVIMALPRDAWGGVGVEASPDGQDARAAGRVAGHPRKAAGGASTGRETACQEAGR